MSLSPHLQATEAALSCLPQPFTAGSAARFFGGDISAVWRSIAQLRALGRVQPQGRGRYSVVPLYRQEREVS